MTERPRVVAAEAGESSRPSGPRQAIPSPESPAIELTVRPPSAHDVASTSAGAGAAEANLDPWLARVGATAHPWAGLRGAQLRAAAGRLQRWDPAWAVIAPVLSLSIGLGALHRAYRGAIASLPNFEPRDCGAFDACFGQPVYGQTVPVRHEHTNAFTGRSETWTEESRSIVAYQRPRLTELPGYEAWPNTVLAALTSPGEDWSKACLAALDACLAAEPDRRAAFNQQVEAQRASHDHRAWMSVTTVLLVSVAAYGALLGVIALARRAKRVPRDWGDASPAPASAENRGSTSSPGREAVSLVVAQIEAAEDERSLTTLLSTLTPPVRREALLNARAALARKLLARAEACDWPALFHHVRAALLEARPHVAPSTQRQITTILNARDLPTVSLDAWRQGRPRLAAEALRGGWKPLREYIQTFAPEPSPELLDLLTASRVIKKSEIEALKISPESLLTRLGPGHHARYHVAACLDDSAAKNFAQADGVPFALLRPDAFLEQNAIAPEVIRSLTRFESMSALLEQLPMPEDAGLREAYARRLVGAWAVRPAEDAPMAKDASQACVICFEDFSYPPLAEPSMPGEALHFCKHPPNAHDACMTDWVRTKVNENALCTCPTCRQPMAPEELLRRGMGARSVDGYARIVMNLQGLDPAFSQWLEKEKSDRTR